MARSKYFQFLLNEEGQPVDHASVNVYNTGTTNAAIIYETETSVVAIPSAALTTTDSGYFGFWVDPADYPEGMQFDIDWSKPGSITAGGVDGIYLPMIYSQVNENDTDTTKDKLVSNNLARSWSARPQLVTSTGVSASSFTSVSGGSEIETGYGRYYNVTHSLTQAYPTVSVYISGGRTISHIDQYISNTSLRVWMKTSEVTGAGNRFNFTIIG